MRAFFFPLKDIIPNVINCGLAPTSVLPRDYCRVSLDSDQFNWNHNSAEGVWKLFSIQHSRDVAGNVANRSRKLKGTLGSLLEVRGEKEELTLINQKHDAVEKRKYFGV